MTEREDEFDGRPELMKKRARTEIFARAVWTVLFLYILGSLTLLSLNAYQGQQTRDTLLDCTEPSGECYQEGQDRTALLIQQLIDSNNLGDLATQEVVILTASCAESPEVKAEENQTARIELLKDCVNAHLEKP